MALAVALVDADATYRKDLVRRLGRLGVEAEGFAGEASLCRRMLAKPFDLLVLGLEGDKGLAIARYLRRVASIGIVVLTKDERRAALLQRASDCVDVCLSKSITLESLAANLYCLARAIDGKRATGLIAWRLSDDTSCLISPDGRSLPLHTLERCLLARLLIAPGELVLYAELVAELRVESEDFHEGQLKHLVCRLRQKIASRLGTPLPLRSVRRQGYQIRIRRAS
jgi:DNA-binding response OmpR family regulator